MLRRLLLPVLGFAFFATAASAQTTPTASAAPALTKKEARQYARAERRAARTLTAREKRAAAAAAKAEADKAKVAAQPTTANGTAWSGWSNDPLPQTDSTPHRPTMNLSVAPGMPMNQVGHGVTTDYHGRPLRRPEVASTTLPTAR